MSNRAYVILNASEAESINYSQVLEESPNTLRWNNDKTKTFVKFEGATPSWLEGKTSYTNEEILAILNAPNSGWRPEE